MSVIGIDFGSHTTSYAVWNKDNNSLEVIADDLGFRTTPCMVAFRGDEVLVGQSAVLQQHKNISNTFDNVRKILLDDSKQNVFVPALDKEISTEELCSHFFRNIHNQIKQQAGKVIRECVVAVPTDLSPEVRKRVVDSARAGGLRVKGFVDDASAVLLTHGLDEPKEYNGRVLVLDIGWSRAGASIYQVRGGLFHLVQSISSTEFCGEKAVQLVAAHCAKEFQRKAKVSCTDSSKAMTLLRRECEGAIKALSIGAEATIDIDSLFEGIDFSTKISRARLEDILSIPIIHLKNMLTQLVANAGLTANDVTKVALCGGLAAVPKVATVLKASYPNVDFFKTRNETTELHAIGAALHGKYLIQQSLIESVPTARPVTQALTADVLVKSTGEAAVLLTSGTPVPAVSKLTAELSAASGFLQYLIRRDGKEEVVGEVVFALPEGVELNDASKVVNIVTTVENGQLSVAVQSTGEQSSVELGSAQFPIN